MTTRDQIADSPGQLPRFEGADFQREDMDAALRAATFTNRPDARGVAVASQTAQRLLREHPDSLLDVKSFRDETTVVVRTGALRELARFVRDECGFALLSDVSPCDWLGHDTPARFSVSYIFTRLVPGAPRVRLQVWVEEGEHVPSLVDVYPTADWHEREAFDFFGIEFDGHPNLRRLLMSDDWVGHPLRKDYPIGGEPVKFTNFLRET